MNTQILKAQIKTLTDKVMQESASIKANEQYRTEYAMQSLGAILADLRRIEEWNKSVQIWQEERLMLDRAPSLKDFFK
jgi:hypothetical protein